MKIFEFHFNSTAQKDRFFKTFLSDDFYFVGELSHALPQNAQFLNRLLDVAKNEYYASPKGNLKKALQATNSFLATETQDGNIDWLGNLHVAFLNFSQKETVQSFAFAKSGTIQVLIARRGNFIDLGKNMSDFKKFVMGTVFPQDKIIVCTKELFDVLLEKNFLQDIAFFKEEKQFKALFKNKEKEFSHLTGILFVVYIEEIVFKKVQRKDAKIRIPHINIPWRILPLIFLLLLLGIGFLIFNYFT